MIRRQIVTAMVVLLVSFAAGCGDVTPPTAATPKASLPPGPSRQANLDAGSDLTFNIPGGTLRIWDTEIVALAGRLSGDTAWVNAGVAVTLSGKWQIVTSDCTGCYAALSQLGLEPG